jgi:hypothetical protein
LGHDLDAFLKQRWIMSVNTFLSELKKFFINSFSDPVYQDGVLYFIIEELPNPRDSGLFKILCGSTQIALDAVTLDEPGVVIANELIGLHAATIRKYPYQKIEYVNIAPWAQAKIEARMARIGLKI